MSETEVQASRPIPSEPDHAGSAATVFVGLSSVVEAQDARLLAAALTEGAARAQRIVLAYPGSDQGRASAGSHGELLTYPLPNVDTGTPSPWAQRAAAQVALLGIAVDEQAAAVVLLHGSPEAAKITALADPVLTRQADLVMADYTHAPYDGLLNTAIVAPLSRALYGRRVHFPLASDFALSPRMAARLAVTATSRSGVAVPVLWPVTCAAGIDAAVTEAPLHVPLVTPATDMELRDVLTQLVGSAFAEMETHAPLWQRVRPAPAPALSSVQARAAVTPAAARIDTEPMIQSFLLASRNLQDVWNLVLPPVTLLDLKRITTMPAARFTLPDELWVRIVYDFALAYRLRTLNRTHLLGALTPLYLGWVASYVRQTDPDDVMDAAARFEKLAQAFEAGKPYLVRRWRWPDRFNP